MESRFYQPGGYRLDGEGMEDDYEFSGEPSRASSVVEVHARS